MSTAIFARPDTQIDSWLIWKRCLWKESKQILPLMLVLLVIGLFLQLIGLLTPSLNAFDVHGTILVLVPGLLAVGVGPMLVSQEKELRTLSWMGGLPVSRRTIVLAKILVGIAALLIAWVVGLIIVSCVHPEVLMSGRMEARGTYAVLWPLNTIFLLVVSFALAWICPTAISTLICILPIAILPMLLEAMESEFFERTILYDPASKMASVFGLVVNYSIVGAIVVLIALRYGRSSFVARSQSSSFLAWLRSVDLRLQRTSGSTQRPQGMIPSLLWQIITQNRMPLVAVASLILLPLIGRLLCEAHSQDKYVPMLFWMFGCGALILSWLGTSVFGSDGTKNRIRFLADRGVSPSTVWWTRQVFPLGIMLTGLIVWFFLVQWIATRQPASVYPREMPPVPWLPIACMGLGIYSFTQWSTQWLRSSLVVFCAAPAIAIATMAYFTTAVTSFGAPYWLIAISLLLPFAASFSMMRPWMDGRLGWKYWLSHAVWLMVTLIIPLAPFLIDWGTYPGMPSSVRSSLLSEAVVHDKRAEQGERGVMELTILEKAMHAGAEDVESEPIRSALDTLDRSEDFIEAALNGFAGPVTSSSWAIRFMLSEASLVSLQMDSSADDSKTRTRYARAIQILHAIADRLRKRPRLIEQENADRIERWLVKELQTPGRRNAFPSEQYQVLVNQLADDAARNQSRRRALIASWQTQSRAIMTKDFGGFDSYATPEQSMLASWLVRDRHVSRLTHLLLLHLEGTQKASESEPFAKLKEAWGANIAFEPDESLEYVFSLITLPGLLWHGEWEQQAKTLGEKQ
jgi:hypothetical protein